MIRTWFARLTVIVFAIVAISPLATPQAQAAAPAWLEVYPAPADQGTVVVNGYEGTFVALNSVGDWIDMQAWPNQWSQFVGWYAEGIGYISYDSHYAFELNMDMTIYAEFNTPPITPTHTLTVEAGEGGMVYCGVISEDWTAWGMTNYYVTEGQYTAVEANPYGGKRFSHWTDGYGNWVSGDNPYYFSVYSDMYLLANFTDDQYTVVTLPGEGWGLMPDYVVDAGGWFTLPECTFNAPEGKRFDRWDVGYAGEGLAVNGNITITALWADIPSYLVYIDSNGADGYMADPYLQEGTVYTLPENAFTPPIGKRFAGWYVEGMGVLQPGATVTVNSPVTLIAQWELIPCTVNFNANGGTGTMESQTLPYSSSFTLPECSFTPPAGKQFAGWDLGQPGTATTLLGDLTLVAQWEDIPPKSGSSTGSNSSSSASGSGSASSTASSAGSASVGASSNSTSGSASAQAPTSNGAGSTQNAVSELPIIPILLGVIAVALIAIFVLLLVRGKKGNGN